MAKNFEILDEKSLIEPAERPNLAVIDFAITFGIVWALFVTIITILGKNFLVLDFIQFLENFYPGYSRPLGAFDLFLAVVYGFAHGFLFGLLVSYLYNLIRGPIHCGIKLINPKKIIETQTPWKLSDGKNTNGNDPYTIAIIANPVLESEILPEDDPLKWRRDPILDNPSLFQAKVACILGSLASNQMIRDTFLDNMRIITYFNPDLAPKDKIIKKDDKGKALCSEKDFDIIIEPIQEQNGEQRLNKFLTDYVIDADNNPYMVDVVFAVTASETHTRSSALYTKDKTTGTRGPKFKFWYQEGGNEIKKHHDRFPEVPGLIAYSAWDTRLKTPLHEFAHAMSSTVNGIIHDEYYDDIPKHARKKLELGPSLIDFILGDKDLLVINKRHFKTGNDLPDLFGIYSLDDAEDGKKFKPDKAIIKPPEYEAIVPERRHPRIPCTMDISGDENRFDRLIEKFMFDRLEAKSTR